VKLANIRRAAASAMGRRELFMNILLAGNGFYQEKASETLPPGAK
jgi:hypothetical protein